MLAVDPDARLQAVTVLRRCAFHYEFTSKYKLYNPTVYESYRRQGVSFCLLDPAWIANIEFASGSSYLLTYESSRSSFYTYRLGVNVADLAEGFRPVRIRLSPMLHGWYPPTLWRRRPTGRHLITVGLQRNVSLIELESGQLCATMASLPQADTCSVALSYDGKIIFYGKVSIYRTDTTTQQADAVYVSSIDLYRSIRYPDHTNAWRDHLVGFCRGTLLQGGFHRNNLLLYTSSRDENDSGRTLFTVWDIKTPGRVFEFRTTFTNWIYGELFHPSRNEIIFCFNPFEIAVFVISGRVHSYRLAEAHNLTGSIVAVTYSPCGNYILSSHKDPSNVHIFHATTLQLLHTIIGVGSAPLWFCAEENESCIVGPDPHHQLHLINFKAERRRHGF
jgi:WD40 repeat protein